MDYHLLTDNERLALDAIRRHDGLTRTDIAGALGVTRAHATNVTKALSEKELIVDVPVLNGAKGQPTRIVRLRDDSTFALGATFTKHHVELGLINWIGQLKARETALIENTSMDAITAVIDDFESRTLSRLRIAKKRLCGVGLSVPGDFVEDRRKINAVYFPEFAGVDLADAMSKRLGRPVSVENDSSSAAWGEAVIGAGKPLKSFIFVHIGHGLGGGFVINGRLFRGHHGNAGAFGAPYPDLDAPRPSGADLLRTLRSAGHDVADFEDLKALDPAKDPALSCWIERAGGQLASVLTVLARAFDPEAVVIGGRLPLPIVEALISRIQAAPFCAHDRDVLPVPKLVASALGDAGGVIGAAALCFEPIFYVAQD